MVVSLIIWSVSGHCKKLAPEFSIAGEKLKKNTPPLAIAKVDATANNKLATQFEVKGYPTLLWFVKGVHSEFNGGRTADEIVNWILKRSGPPSIKLESKDELEAKKTSDKLVVRKHTC